MTPLQCPSVITVAGHNTGRGVGLKAATCCKTVGTGITGKGLCLGLGLGIGIWGPVGLVGIGIVGGYYYWKKANEMLD
jgi:hypothetical protein